MFSLLPVLLFLLRLQTSSSFCWSTLSSSSFYTQHFQSEFSEQPDRASGTATRQARWAMSEDPLVLSKVHSNGLGAFSMNRPKYLNAADKEMTGMMLSQLAEWESGDQVKALLLTSTSGRALCSGGDVKALAAALYTDPASTLPQEALSNEYKLVNAISTSRVPCVAIMDGVTMGFGVGISGFSTFRVITERTIFAMPENAIALIPDVGFSHLLRHAPSVCKFLTMTGARLGGDLLYSGIGTHFVSCDKIGDLKQALERASFGEGREGELRGVIEKFAMEPDHPSRLEKMRPAIDACFGPDLFTATSVRAAIEEKVQGIKEEEGKEEEEERQFWTEALRGFDDGCPFTVTATLHHQQSIIDSAPPEGLTLDTLEGVLMAEYRAMLRLARRPDFAEGVRSRLVDKDNAPAWQPAALAEVSGEDVRACFAPLGGEGELLLRKRHLEGSD